MCTGSKPTVVIPALELNWLHNSTLHQGLVTENNDILTNTLNIDTSDIYNSGNYTCQARLIIPDSSTITKFKTTIVIIKRKNAIFHHNFLKRSIFIFSCSNTIYG